MVIKDWLQNSPLPRLEARMLLQQATGLTRAQLISHDLDPLSIEQEHNLNQWQIERINGKPMAYILGEREFYGRNFKVSEAVLIPRPETEHLIETVVEYLPINESIKIWDLGTGSGIIAITLKLEIPNATVFASDVSEHALAIAQMNAKQLEADIHFAQGSWFDCEHNREPKASFDFIVSNPPYIDSHDCHLSQGDVRFEPKIALTDFNDGLSAYKVLFKQAQDWLKPQGYLIVEHGYNQKEALQDLLTQYHYKNTVTLKDLAGQDRITLAQK